MTIEIRPGASAYAGTTSHGVTSHAYGVFAQSFVFIGVPTSGPTTYTPDPTKLTDVGHTISASSDTTQSGTWTTQASSYRGQNGQCFTIVFSGGGSLSPRLWGSGPYTDDSSIATAAVHAGLITTERGGSVTIEIRPGASSYAGSTSHGVTSQDFGAFAGSFVFIGATANAFSGNPTTGGATFSPSPGANPAGQHYFVINYTGKVQNRHDFIVDFAHQKVVELNNEFRTGTEDIQGRMCEEKKRLAIRTDFRATGYWIEYDWVFLQDGKVIAGYYRDGGGPGTSAGELLP